MMKKSEPFCCIGGVDTKLVWGGHSYGGGNLFFDTGLPDSTRYGVDIQVVQVFVSSTNNVSGLGCLVLWMRVCTRDDFYELL